MLSVQLGDEVVAFSENQKFAKLQTLCNGFVYVDDVRSGYGRSRGRITQRSWTGGRVSWPRGQVSEGEQVCYAFIEETGITGRSLKKEGGSPFATSKDKKFLEKWNGRDVDVLLLNAPSLHMA